tara:strand:+ start:10819 stop:13293 length:2475 start_codon:yes stop_codon:yes gene_type:complete
MLAASRSQNVTCSEDNDVAEIARINALTFNEVRNELNAAHIRNSFKGADGEQLRMLLFLHYHNAVPSKYFCHKHAATCRMQSYSDIINALSLQALGALVSDEEWQHYEAKGWLQYQLPLTCRERCMVELVHAVQLAELGVDPDDPSTYEHADEHAGITRTKGWLRNPAVSHNSVYLSSHPLLYAKTVGVYARSVLSLGKPDNAQSRRACMELIAQVYNTKLKLPCSAANEFAHMDLQWGCPDILTPAPQIIVATSNSLQSDSTENFRIRFINMRSAGNLAQLRAEAAGGPAYEPYNLPRRNASNYHGATRVPAFAENQFDSELEASGPATHTVGSVLIFDALAAHRVTEPADATTIRTAEYPLLVSPALHGVPNQSRGEIHAALLRGRSPLRWAHVFTGNLMISRAAGDLQPIFPFLPIAIATDLGQCLYQLDDWGAPATKWLLAACQQLAKMQSPTAVNVDAIVMQCASDLLVECRAHVESTIEAYVARLRTYAAPSAAALAEWHHRQMSGRCSVGALDQDVRTTVPSAARSALKRLGLECTVGTTTPALATSSSDCGGADVADDAEQLPDSSALPPSTQRLCDRFNEVRRTLPMIDRHSRDVDERADERAQPPRPRSRSVSPIEVAAPGNWLESLLNAIANGEIPKVTRDRLPMSITKLPAAFTTVCNSESLRDLGATDHGRLCRASALMSVLCAKIDVVHRRCYSRLRRRGGSGNGCSWYAFTDVGFRSLATTARDISFADALAAINRPVNSAPAECPHCGQTRICAECDVARVLDDEVSGVNDLPARPSLADHAASLAAAGESDSESDSASVSDAATACE